MPYSKGSVFNEETTGSCITQTQVYCQPSLSGTSSATAFFSSPSPSSLPHNHSLNTSDGLLSIAASTTADTLDTCSSINHRLRHLGNAYPSSGLSPGQTCCISGLIRAPSNHTYIDMDLHENSCCPSFKFNKRKRLTISGDDGAKYSLTGKRIGRPRIDRENTRCHECLTATTPQWRYLTRKEYIECWSESLQSSLFGLSLANDRTKISLCNACWLRAHKARRRRKESRETYECLLSLVSSNTNGNVTDPELLHHCATLTPSYSPSSPSTPATAANPSLRLFSDIAQLNSLENDDNNNNNALPSELELVITNSNSPSVASEESYLLNGTNDAGSPIPYMYSSNTNNDGTTNKTVFYDNDNASFLNNFNNNNHNNDNNNHSIIQNLYIPKSTSTDDDYSVSCSPIMFTNQGFNDHINNDHDMMNSIDLSSNIGSSSIVGSVENFHQPHNGISNDILLKATISYPTTARAATRLTNCSNRSDRWYDFARNGQRTFILEQND